MDTLAFHRATAAEIERLYASSEHTPEGWRETAAWHWEQAGAYHEATEATLKVAELRLSELSYNEARRWIERALCLLDMLDVTERRLYEMRVYALTISVLEFGGQYREALGYARLLTRIAEQQGNIEAQIRSYLAIGRVQRELGLLTLAENEMLRALSVAERYQHIELESEARMHLAKVHQLQGRHLEAFQQLELAQSLPSDEGRVARITTGIGDVYRVLGASQEALQFYHRALKIEIGTSNRLGQAMLYEKLGLSHLEADRHGEALQCLEEALRLRTDLNDTVGRARSHTILGTIQGRIGRHDLAMYHFEQARDYEALVQNRRGQTIALTNLGDAAHQIGDTARAHEAYAEALALARAGDDRIALARVLQRLGDLRANEGRQDLANEHWKEALTIRESLGHSEEAIALRGRISTGRVK